MHRYVVNRVSIVANNDLRGQKSDGNVVSTLRSYSGNDDCFHILMWRIGKSEWCGRIIARLLTLSRGPKLLDGANAFSNLGNLHGLAKVSFLQPQTPTLDSLDELL